jgi:roadblock/LC7 domain-containing protein
MKVNGISQIDSDGGKYIVLIDFGNEGLIVEEQYQSFSEAIKAVAQTLSGNASIVMLADSED